MSCRRAITAVDLGLLACVLGVVYVMSPFVIEGDGIARYRALSRALGDGVLDRTPYSLVGPLLSAPLWWIGSALGTPEWWVGRFNFVLFVACLATLYRVLTPAIDRALIVRFLLLLSVASMFPHHLGRYYGDVATALLIAVGLAVVCVQRSYWGWLLVVLGAANTPATLVGVGFVSLAWTWRTRDLRHLAPVAAAVALILGEAWLRRGGPFVTGYEGNRGAESVLPFSGQPGFSYPFALGVISILFSFGKGLLWFAPGLLLWARRPSGSADDRTDPLGTLLRVYLVFLAGLVLVYANWWAWYGGVFWGPRFFLFASIPASVAIASRLAGGTRSPSGMAMAAAIITVWSCWVGASGLVVPTFGLDACTADHYALEFLCWYVPEFSVLFGPLVDGQPLGSVARAVVAGFASIGVYAVAMRPVAATVGQDSTPHRSL